MNPMVNPSDIINLDAGEGEGDIPRETPPIKPEVEPNQTPQIEPRKNAPEVTPGRISQPEVFPQHSPDATPPPDGPEITPNPGTEPGRIPEIT